MAVISIANAKGGAGKTTAALLLAMEFAQAGGKVVIFDCDPLAFAAKWHGLPGAVDGITVVTGVTFANLGANLRAQSGQADHVIIDLSGARDALIALAAGLSDLMLIPVQGCTMDAQGAVHVLEIIGQVANNAHSHIDHAVVLTRVSSLVTTRAIRSVKARLAERNVLLLDTPIIERSVYRDMFEHGGSLYTIDETKVSNLAKAQRNMQGLALEVLRLVNGQPHLQSSGSLARICYKAPDRIQQPEGVAGPLPAARASRSFHAGAIHADP
ncbi:ParA family protein [Rhizobium giardinii]|uniref:Chromosome partitioning protein n=1 Tax=Rhizobium giardinii TaxID=56731 RepID=A0A7W8U8V9_9HYPH|nr:ParA family protein [Rhizobium giardinii]MBB5534072.1 chromosome partitioning protein [Rhizobium giardinii]